MLKKPSVAGTYIDKITVATHTSAVNTAVTARLKGDTILLVMYSHDLYAATMLY